MGYLPSGSLPPCRSHISILSSFSSSFSVFLFLSSLSNPYPFRQDYVRLPRALRAPIVIFAYSDKQQRKDYKILYGKERFQKKSCEYPKIDLLYIANPIFENRRISYCKAKVTKIIKILLYLLGQSYVCVCIPSS